MHTFTLIHVQQTEGDETITAQHSKHYLDVVQNIVQKQTTVQAVDLALLIYLYYSICIYIFLLAFLGHFYLICLFYGCGGEEAN